MSPPPLSDTEAKYYYVGLPSSPRLVARTSPTPWVLPTGWGEPRDKQLGVVVNHKLNTIWEFDVAPKILACLDDMGVLWTSADVVRIGLVVNSSPPIVLWIGVKPKSLTGENTNAAAFRCLDVLKEFGITDVEVEIRESSVIRSAGPKLLEPAFTDRDPTAVVRDPLTHALGLPISAEATPYIAGAGGFFMAEGGGSDDLLLITARHVVLPLTTSTDTKFERENESQPRFNVVLLGDKAYESCLASIQAKISGHHFNIELRGRELQSRAMRGGGEAVKYRKATEEDIETSKKAIEALGTFYNDVTDHWATYASRVLGHIVYSPPIRLGAGTAAEQYTEDYAIIKIDKDKIDRTTFEGNAIDIGTKFEIGEYLTRLFPHIEKPSVSDHNPVFRLLSLQGTISDEEMRHQTALDQNNELYLTVIKDGSTTGVTIGRASGIMSFVREYSEDGSHETSKEWPILPYDKKSGAFSAPGDSGAVIVDGLGRFGGLLTGGAAGISDSSNSNLDISYATPFTFIEKSIKAKYPNAHLNLA